jgi:deaminated glutathione amidase
MYTQLVQKMGAQVLLVPSAFTVPTGQAHWHTLLRGKLLRCCCALSTDFLFFCICRLNLSLAFDRTARAIENQCYVIAAAQYGQHNEKRVSYGHSLIVDGWGSVVADAGGMDSDIKPSSKPSVITSEIDLDAIASIRERMPIQQHRHAALF